MKVLSTKKRVVRILFLLGVLLQLRNGTVKASGSGFMPMTITIATSNSEGEICLEPTDDSQNTVTATPCVNGKLTQQWLFDSHPEKHNIRNVDHGGCISFSKKKKMIQMKEDSLCADYNVFNWWFTHNDLIQNHAGNLESDYCASYDETDETDTDIPILVKSFPCDTTDQNQMFISKTIPSKIGKLDKSLCLGRGGKNNMNAQAMECDDLSVQHLQEWTYDLHTERIMSTFDDKCLDLNEGNLNIGVFHCHKGINQQWTYDGVKIQSKKEGCLQLSRVDGARLVPCDGNDMTQNLLVVGKLNTIESCTYNHECFSNECGMVGSNYKVCCKHGSSLFLLANGEETAFCGSLSPLSPCWTDSMCDKGICSDADYSQGLSGTCKATNGSFCKSDEECLSNECKIDLTISQQGFCSPNPIRISNPSNSRCLGRTLDGEKVKAFICDNDVYQRFQYDPTVNQIKSNDDSNSCLAVRNSDEKVVMAPCTTDKRKSRGWEFTDDGRLKRIGNAGKCLKISEVDSYVLVATCDPNDMSQHLNSFSQVSNGDICNWNIDCTSNVCALESAHVDAKKVCCNNNINIDGEMFCIGLLKGTECLTDSMCASGVCFNSTSTHNGICYSNKIDAGEKCTRDYECSSGACGLHQGFHDAKEEKICCEKTMPYDVNSQTVKYCEGMEEGSRCWEDSMCDYPSNICFRSSLEEKGECKPKALLGRTCFREDECLSGHCGLDSANENATRICCDEAKIEENTNEQYCQHTAPSNATCLSDGMCGGGLICYGSPFSDGNRTGICTVEGGIGDECVLDEDCSTNTCALESSHTTTKICCNNKKEHSGNLYCTELSNDSKCAFDFMCANGVCFAATENKSGKCRSKGKEGDLCIREEDCSTHCGVFNQSQRLCCADIYMHEGMSYCKGLTLQSACFFDETCDGSLVCLGGKNDGIVSGNCGPKANKEGRCYDRDEECSNPLSCGYKSTIGEEAEGYICCEEQTEKICNTNAPDLTKCKHDETCKSGICRKNSITDEIGRCGPKSTHGSTCNRGMECKSALTCALDGAGLTAKNICCRGVVIEAEKYYCNDMPIGSECLSDDMCNDESFCRRKNGLVGFCHSKIQNRLHCEYGYECMSGVCSLESASSTAQNICCDATKTIGSVTYCDNLPYEAECTNDEMCKSGFCHSVTGGTKKVCQSKMKIEINGVASITHGPLAYGSDGTDGTFIQDYSGSASVKDEIRVNLEGNAWKAFEIQDNAFMVEKGSTLTFDFTCNEKVEGHAICIDEDIHEDTYSGAQIRCIPLLGSQIHYWNNVIKTRIDSSWILPREGNTTTYNIPIGLFLPSNLKVKYIIFIQDNDERPSLGLSEFSSIKLDSSKSTLSKHIQFQYKHNHYFSKCADYDLQDVSEEECLVAAKSAVIPELAAELSNFNEIAKISGAPVPHCGISVATENQIKIHYQDASSSISSMTTGKVIRTTSVGWDQLVVANFYSRNGITTAGYLDNNKEVSWLVPGAEDNHFIASANYGKIMFNGEQNGGKVGPTEYTANVRAFFMGNIVVPFGKTKLCIRSDDGSRVYVDGNLLIDNDSVHGPLEKCSDTTPGKHYIQILYFQYESGHELSFYFNEGNHVNPIEDEWVDMQNNCTEKVFVLDKWSSFYSFQSQGQLVVKCNVGNSAHDAFVALKGSSTAVFVNFAHFINDVPTLEITIRKFHASEGEPNPRAEIVWTPLNGEGITHSPLHNDVNFFLLSWDVENSGFFSVHHLDSNGIWNELSRVSFYSYLQPIQEIWVGSANGAGADWELQFAPFQICKMPMVHAEIFAIEDHQSPNPPDNLQSKTSNVLVSKFPTIKNLDKLYENSCLVHLHGLLNFEYDGSYKLILESKEGSRLYFESELVLTIDGKTTTDGAKRKSMTKTVEAGVYEIHITYVNLGTGSESLILMWETPVRNSPNVIPEANWVMKRLPMKCYATPHSVIKDEKCVCNDGYVSHLNGDQEITSIDDTCISSSSSSNINSLHNRLVYTDTDPLRKADPDLSTTTLKQKQGDVYVDISLDDRFKNFTVDMENTFEFNNLSPGRRYKVNIGLVNSEKINFSVVTSCSCEGSKKIDVTGRPSDFVISQRNGHVMFSFKDNSYCENAFSFTRNDHAEEFLGDVSKYGETFTSDYYISSGNDCGAIIKPEKGASDDLMESNLIVGKKYSYCVRAINQIHYMDHPFDLEGLGRTLHSSDDVCSGHRIQWESSIHGLVTTAPNAGSLPIANVTVSWKVLALNGIEPINCHGCTGSTLTNEGGAFQIVFNEDNEAFYDDNGVRHSFPVQIYFSKSSPAPSRNGTAVNGEDNVIRHTFLCNEGQDECSGDVGQRIYLTHLQYEEPVHVYDDTSVPFAGKVFIGDTVYPGAEGCPLHKVEICLYTEKNVGAAKVNTTIVCGETDSEGQYTLAAVLGSRVDYVSLLYYNHQFEGSPNSKFEKGTLIQPGVYYGDNDFIDVQKVSLIVDIVGGLCNLPLGSATVSIQLQSCPRWSGEKFIQREKRGKHLVPAHMVDIQVVDIRENGVRIQNIWEKFQNPPLVRTVDLKINHDVLDSVTSTDEEGSNTTDSGLPDKEDMKIKSNANIKQIEKEEEESTDLVRFQFDGVLKMDVQLFPDALHCTDYDQPPDTDSLHVLDSLEQFYVMISLKWEINKKKNQYCTIVDTDRYKVTITNEVGRDNFQGSKEFFGDLDDDSLKLLTKCVDDACILPVKHDEDLNGNKKNAHLLEKLMTGRPSITPPFTKNIYFGVTNSSNVKHTSAVVVQGPYDKGPGLSFALPTTKPIMILRDPPGGLSYASYENIKTSFEVSTSSTSTTLTNSFGLGMKKVSKHELEQCIGGGVGALELICTRIANLESSTQIFNGQTSLGGMVQLSDKSRSSVFSTTWSYETSQDSWTAGRASDVFVVPNLNVMYKRVKLVKWMNETCSVQTKGPAKQKFLPETTIFDVKAPSSQPALAFYSRLHVLSIKLPELYATIKEKGDKIALCNCNEKGNETSSQECKPADCPKLKDDLNIVQEGLDGWLTALRTEKETFANNTKDASKSINSYFNEFFPLSSSNFTTSILPPSLDEKKEKLDVSFLQENNDKPAKRIQFSGGGNLMTMSLQKEFGWEHVKLACWDGCNAESDTDVEGPTEDFKITALGEGIRGFVSPLNFNVHVHHESTHTSSGEDNTAISFTVGDDDIDDEFVVDLYYDDKYGSIIFKTVAGRSKCPHEANTAAVDDPTLSIISYPPIFVFPDEDMIFELEFSNIGVIGKGRNAYFYLYMNHKDNPDGLQMVLDGMSMGLKGASELFIPAEERVTKTLIIRRGPRKYEYTAPSITFEGKCEDDNTVDNLPGTGDYYPKDLWKLIEENSDGLWDNSILGKTKYLFNVLTLDEEKKTQREIKFVEPCPKVEWAGELKRDGNFVVNTESSDMDNLMVTVFNPKHSENSFFKMATKSGARLENVRLLYRELGNFHWSIARTMVIDDGGDETNEEVDFAASYAKEDSYGYSLMKWMLAGMVPEGSYEVKLETKCEQLGGPADIDSYNSRILPGVIDLTRPAQYGKVLPLRDYVLFGEEITIVFTEPLRCERPLPFDIHIEIEDTDISLDKEELQVVCEKRKIGFQIDLAALSIDVSNVMGKAFSVEIGKVGVHSVSNVFDKNGNTLDPIKGNVKFNKKFADLNLDEASVSFTFTLGSECVNGSVSIGNDELLLQIESLLGLSSEEKDRVQLMALKCINDDAVASIKIKPSGRVRRHRGLRMENSIFNQNNEDPCNNHHSIALFQNLRDASNSSRDEDNTTERRMLVVEDKNSPDANSDGENKFSVSSLKILPCSSDLELVTTNIMLQEEEDELYNFASTDSKSGSSRNGVVRGHLSIKKSDQISIVEEVERLATERERRTNKELETELKELKIELIAVCLACMSISLVTLLYLSRNFRKYTV